MVMDVVNNDMIAKFQVGYLSYPRLNQNKAFKYQVERSMISKFCKKKIPIKIVLEKYNTCIIALLMFYEVINTMIFKLLGSVIYCITNNYICVYYLCLHQGLIYFEQKVFEHTTLNGI